MPRFYVLSGPDLGKTADAGEGSTFGRAADCAVSLRGNSISRNHAQLEKHGDVWVLVDLGSRNGISKDGARSERIELADGDIVKLGDVELRFRAEAEATSAPPRAARPAPAPTPAPPPPAKPAAARDEIELEDIELEDDVGKIEIDFDPYAAPEPPKAPTPGPPAPKPAAKPSAGSAPAPAPRTRVAERAAAAGIAMPAGARAAGGGVELRDAGRPVIQFHKVPDRQGFLVADLSQYPLWVKLAAGLLVTVVFVAIFVFAFRGATLLKGDTSSASVEEEPLD